MTPPWSPAWSSAPDSPSALLVPARYRRCCDCCSYDSLTAALLLAVQAVTVLVLGLLGLVGVVIEYMAFYTVHGSLNAAHTGLVHRRAPSGNRATVLSLSSLLSRFGALPAGVAISVVAADHDTSWALLVTAAVLLPRSAVDGHMSGVGSM